MAKEASPAATNESVADPTLIVSAEGRITALNEEGARVFGYGRGELLGRMLETLIPESARGRHGGHRAGFFARPRPREMGAGLQCSGVRKDGGEFPIQIRLTPLETEAGLQVQATIRTLPWRDQSDPVLPAVDRDLAGRRRTDDDLRRFRIAMDVTVDSIYLTDPSTMRFHYVNDAACRRFGYTREQLMQKTSYEIVGKTREQVRREYEEAMAAGERGTRMVSEYLRSDGSRGWTELHRRALRDGDGWLIVTIGRDITERRRADQELREERQRLSLVTDNMPAMIAYADADCRFRYANLRYRLFYSGSDAPIEGKTIAEVLTPQAWQATRQGVERSLAGEAVNYGGERRLHDGSVRYVSVSLVPHRDDAEGRVLGLYVLVHDVTAQHEAETALRESEAALRNAQEMTGVAHVVVRTDGSYERWSENWPRLVGLEPAQLPKSTRESLERIHPEDRERFRATVVEAARSRRRTEFEYRFLRGSEVLQILQTMELLSEPDASGRSRWFVTMQDITAQKRAEEALREREAGLRHAHQMAGLAHIVMRPDGAYERWSESLPQLLGLDATRLPRSMHESIAIVHPEDRERFRATTAEAGRNMRRAAMEYRIVRGDGATVHLRVTMEPFSEPDANGRAYWFVTAQDITEQKRVESALRQSEAKLRELNAELEQRVRERTAELQAANRDLEAFGYTVSHDLRAPLRSVVAFSSLLRTEEAPRLSADGQLLVQRIDQSARRASALVHALLEFANLGNKAVAKSGVAMQALAEEVVRELAAEGGSARAECRVGGLPDCRGDAVLLRQVWRNLVGNAFKYSRDSEAPLIEIGYDAAAGAYFVRDNGAGFDMTYADKLFGVFERMHSQAEFEGTGIGLAIVRRIVERHGGRVWANAAVGRGASFWFSLPG